MSQDLQNIRLISGPYRATKLWNAAVRAFHSGMPTSRHRRGLRVFDNCFTGLEATAWLHQHLTSNPNFGSSVTQEQATTLFKKFLKSGLLEDAISGATAVQLKEKGLYRLSSVSPLHALRTPGRHSTSDLRASTRRLHAAQQQQQQQQQQQAAHTVVPLLRDAKAVVGDATSPVSVPRSRNLLHQRPYNDRQNPGRQSGRESYKTLSHEAILANARQHHNQQQHQIQSIRQNHLNVGSGERNGEKENNWRDTNNDGSDEPRKCYKASGNRLMSSLDDNKENVGSIKGAVMTERPRGKGGRVDGPSESGEDVLKYFKRPALRAIENTTVGGSCNSVSTHAGDTAAIRNSNYKDKLNSNVYIPLGEIVKCTSINSRDSSKDYDPNCDDRNVKTELNPKQHNARNTMSEFNGERNINNDMETYKIESNCGDKKSRSRVKSFLIKSSGNSKYHYLIPKFGVDTTTASSNKGVLTTSATTPYANSKTISPKLLHAVTTTVPSGQPTTNTLYQSIDTHRKKKEEKIGSDGFTIPKVPDPPSCNQFLKPTVAVECRSNLLKKVSPSDLVPLKFNSGSSIASAAVSVGGGSQTNLLATFVGNPAMELRLEQAYMEAWLQILDASVCGTPLSLPSSLVHGPTLLHNQQRVTPRGVMHVPPGHPDDLPHWLLAAMRFLAHWPSSQSDGRQEGGSIPNYPGVEADVYRMVRDYFVHQTTPVIPSAVATALLEVLSAVEFLDLTFRDPRHRFGKSSQLSDKFNNKNSSLDPLTQLNPKQRRSFVDLQALEDDCCEGSVFATLPRSIKKNPRGNDSFKGLDEEGGLCASDSVEDLMLNMSIAGQQQQCQQDVMLQHSTIKNNPDVRSDPSKSGVYGNLASPESHRCELFHADGASIAGRSVGSGTPGSWQSSPYPSQASLGSSNVFLDDVSLANNQRRSNSRHNSIPEIMDVEEGSFRSRESETSSRNNSMENSLSNLTRLSSTNISHIEHFNKSSTGAVYVTGDDIRRRKKKRRFFSRASKKNKVEEGIENCDRTTPDLRRYSVYECLPLVSDVSGSSEITRAYSRPGSNVELRDIRYQNDGDPDVYSVVKPMGSHAAQGKTCANNGLYLSVSNPSLHSDSNTIHAINKKEYLPRSHQKKLSQGVANLHPEPASLARNVTPNDAKVWVSGAPSWSDVSAPAAPSSLSDTRAQLLRSTDIDHVALPPNSCFETAFTSDSPKTRIIPQKSVDTLHLRQLKRRRKSGTTLGPRPKSIAVPQHRAERFTEMTDHENSPGYGYPTNSRGSLSCIGSSVDQDYSTGKHYWNNSPSMFEISSPYRPLSVADLATEPMSLQTQSCGGTGGLKATAEKHLRYRAVSVLADTSFNRSRSTGDLNLGEQAWPSEQRLVTADSSSGGHFGVDSGHKGSSGALSSMSSRGLSLVHRVRDSIRRRKGGVKDTSNISSSSVVASRKRHRSKKGSATTTGADSSNGDNTSGCQSINSSCVSTNASCQNGGSELKSSESSDGVINSKLTMECQRPVQYAKVINAERGREVHEQNVQTLRRLRTLSGGFANPCLSPASSGNQCNGTDPTNIGDTALCCTSHASKEGTVISPIIACASSGFCQKEQSTPRVKPSLMSPFSPSSGGGDTMDTASMVSFSDHRSYPDTVDSRPSSSCCSSEAFMSARAAPSFQIRSSVTTTNYNTHLFTNYARNHNCNQPCSTISTGYLANNSPADGAKQLGCSIHVGNCSGDGGDDRKKVQHQHHSSTSRAVMSELGSSRSPSLSSLYTTALACYDESDPQPFALTQLTADAGGAACSPLAYHEASSSPLAQENSEMAYECMKMKMSESSCSCCNSFAKLKTSKDCSSSNNSSSVASVLRCKQTTNDSNHHSSNCNDDSCCCKSSPSVNSNEKPTTTGSGGRLRNATTTMDKGVTTSGGLNRSCGRSSWHDAVPRVHTEEGTTRLRSCVQLLLLLLQPVARRRLHLLLRLLHKMSNNTQLDLNSCNKQTVTETLDTCCCPGAAVCCHKQQERRSKACDVSVKAAALVDGSVAISHLQHQCNCNHGNKAGDFTKCGSASTEDPSDHHQRQEESIKLNSSTRDRVLSELGWCILRGCNYGSTSAGAVSDEASCRRLLRLLVDQHQTLLQPSLELEEATVRRLEEALCFPSHHQARSANNENFRSATTTTTATSAAGPELRDVFIDDVRGNCVTLHYWESNKTTLDSEAYYTNANNVNKLRNCSAPERITCGRFDDNTLNSLTRRARVQNVKYDSSQQTQVQRVNAGPSSTGTEDSNYGSVSQGPGLDDAFLVPHQESVSRFLPPKPNPCHSVYGHPGPMPSDGIETLSYQRYSSTSHFPVRHDDGLPSRPKLPSPPPPYFSTDRSTTCSTLPLRTTGSNDLRNSRRPLSVAFNHGTHGANFKGFNNETYYMSTYDAGGQEYDRSHKNATTTASYANGGRRRAMTSSMPPSTGQPSRGIHASTGQGLSYCIQVAPSEWEQQRGVEEQQRHLRTLLQQIVQDTSGSDRDKKTRLKQFAAVHPSVYQCEVLNIPPHLRCSDGGAPAKKKGGLRGIMKLASLSSLSRNKHATKL